jgi:hypothetical protein
LGKWSHPLAALESAPVYRLGWSQHSGAHTKAPRSLLTTPMLTLRFQNSVALQPMSLAYSATLASPAMPVRALERGFRSRNRRANQEVFEVFLF